MNAVGQSRWLSLGLPTTLLVLAAVLVMVQVERPAALVRVWIPWAEIGSLAMVMTAVILAGGIDLSVGAIAALSMTVLGVVWHDFQFPIVLAVLAAIVAGVFCGAVNGYLTIAGVSPLITTVATMSVYSGLAIAISNSRRVTDFPESFESWRKVVGIPIQFWLLSLVTVTSWMIVHRMRFGRWCAAIGENRLAAEYSTVPVRRVEWRLYVASGFVASLVAICYVLNRGTAVPDAFRGVELKAITCVVVGGTLISGGRGSIGRTVLGLTIVSHLDIGLEFLGTRVRMVTAEARLIILGVLLILVAVWNQRIGIRETNR